MPGIIQALSNIIIYQDKCEPLVHKIFKKASQHEFSYFKPNVYVELHKMCKV